VGRGIFESAGMYLTQVLSVKRLRQRPVVIINGGNHHFAEKLLSETGEESAYFPILLRETQAPLESTLLAGSLCQDRDVLHPSCPLPADISRGDWLLFPNRGAYGLTASNQQFIGQSAVGELLARDRANSPDARTFKILSVSPEFWRDYHSGFRDFKPELA
jgi:diaminopimelate decarboxylase